MQWVAALTDPDAIRTYLTGVGLPAAPPAIAPPRPPPQRELEFGRIMTGVGVISLAGTVPLDRLRVGTQAARRRRMS